MTAAGPPPGHPPMAYPPMPAGPQPGPPPAPPRMANTVPPRGPGVQPPFVAPPTDRPRTRQWIAIVVSLVLVLGACIGGIATLIATSNAAPAQISDKAEELVGKFLGDLRQSKYEDAHKLLCAQTADRWTVAEMRTDYADFRSFTVGKAFNYRGGDPISVEVPATEVLASGSAHRVYHVQTEDLGLRICGVS